MESRFDMTNFEQTLREHTDQFSMIPSKRVWNGIYNSLHPGSRWPSVSMLLFFLLALVGIGPLNNPADDFQKLPSGNAELSLDETKPAGIFKMKHLERYEKNSTDKSSNITAPGKVISMYAVNNTPNNPGEPISGLKPEKSEPLIISENTTFAALSTVNSQEFISSSFEETGSLTVTGAKLPAGITGDEGLFTRKEKEISLMDPAGEFSAISGLENPDDVLLNSVKNTSSTDINQKKKFELLPDEEINAKKESETINLPERNKRATWIFYITPSVSSAYFSGKPLEDKDPSRMPSSLIVNPSQAGNQMRINARAGLNLGSELNYSLTENWTLISGMQLSYSGFNILSHKVHPSFAELILRNGPEATITKKYITYYGSGEGQDEITLKNNSIQLSVPVGTRYSVWKNNNVEISVFAAVEPLVVLHSHAYLLSADSRNYVNDPDLPRQANVNGQVGSSISFLGDKIRWHISPTFRYQILSTYDDIYPINEHLMDYGIKIGISK